MARYRHDTTSSPPQAGRARRVLAHPLVWLAGGVVAVNVVPLVALGLLAGVPGMNRAVRPVVGAAASLALYWWVMDAWAGRQLTEFPRARACRDLLRGVGLGAGYMTLTLAVLVAAGAYSLTWTGMSWAAVWPALLVNLWPGIVEELTFRGVVLQALERLGGSWVGLVGSSLLFGAAHLLNPAVTVWTALAIALEAGVLLGAAFLLVRNLWLPIGIHYAWDATQDLAGIPQDGGQIVPQGLVSTTVHGPDWLTGLPASIEGSVVTVALGALLALALRAAATRRGTLQSPGGWPARHRPSRYQSSTSLRLGAGDPEDPRDPSTADSGPDDGGSSPHAWG